MAKLDKTTDGPAQRTGVFYHYLKLRGLTIKAVAENSGLSKQTVYNAASKGSFTNSVAEKLAPVLGCQSRELTEGVLLDPGFSERSDLEIVSDEKLFMRTVILSQQRTIENLSFVAREKFDDE